MTMFAGRTVIVTGGSRGIGASCTRWLASHGATVVFTGRGGGHEDGLDQEGMIFVQADAADEDDCRRVVAVALERGGGEIHGLVNNAGMSLRQRFRDATVADWDRIMAVNARSAFLMTRHALAGLSRARGSVVMVSSVAGQAGEEGLALYTASKASLIGLTKALALEIGHEIRVNAICPGQVETGMMAGTLAIPGRRALLASRIPTGALGTPAEVAATIGWMLSPDAGFLNGAVITLDGGETAGLREPRPG